MCSTVIALVTIDLQHAVRIRDTGTRTINYSDIIQPYTLVQHLRMYLNMMRNRVDYQILIYCL